MTAQSIIDQAKDIATRFGYGWSQRLEQIIRFGHDHPDNLPGNENSPKLDDGKYLVKYVKSYFDDLNRNLTLKQVSTKPDPAVAEVLEVFANQHQLSLSPEEFVTAHRYSMAAENLIGLFVERYLANHLEQVGWIWCCGSTLRAIDFLKIGAGDQYDLLQVKNRSNSENSSSSAIRHGTVIKKWHRINARTGQVYWDKLPDNAAGTLSEDGFYAFIRNYVASH